MWIAYSQGRFGFTVQSRLLNALDGRYDRLWPRIGWKIDGNWTRYPGAFQWSMEAPEGHMPLVNQLRGVRLMDALLQHRDWLTDPDLQRWQKSPGPLWSNEDETVLMLTRFLPSGADFILPSTFSSPLMELLLEPVECEETSCKLQLGLRPGRTVRHGNAGDPRKCLRIAILTPN